MWSLQPLQNGRNITDELQNRETNELLSASHTSHWAGSGENRSPKFQQGLNHALQNSYILFNAFVKWFAFLGLEGNFLLLLVLKDKAILKTPFFMTTRLK